MARPVDFDLRSALLRLFHIQSLRIRMAYREEVRMWKDIEDERLAVEAEYAKFDADDAQVSKDAKDVTPPPKRKRSKPTYRALDSTIGKEITIANALVENLFKVSGNNSSVPTAGSKEGEGEGEASAEAEVPPEPQTVMPDINSAEMQKLLKKIT